MKQISKLILPLLILVLILIVYLVYFTTKGLGSFSDFDPNNNAHKDIIVKLVKERGVEVQGESSIFFAQDKNGTVVMIQGPSELPDNFEQADQIILKGHLTKEYFHAHEVYVQ
jgi:cytochrome c-type biogenesis protein CcmE